MRALADAGLLVFAAMAVSDEDCDRPEKPGYCLTERGRWEACWLAGECGDAPVREGRMPPSPAAEATIDLLVPNGSVRLTACNRIHWKDPMGIWGIAIAAKIEAFAVETDSPFNGDLRFVVISIEPSEDLERV